MNPIDQAIILSEAQKYTDSQRLAYIAEEQTTFLPESEIVFESGCSVFFCEAFIPGEQYTVYIDGQKTVSICKTVTIHEDQDDQDGMVIPCLGNTQPLNGVDSGENFVIFYPPSDGEAEIYYLPEIGEDVTTTHSVAITHSTETIHPIDQKFLPPVDSITMNGADGKQYKLTVSGGALNIAEVV